MVGDVVLVEVFPFLFFLDFAFSSESMGVFVLAGVGVSVLRVFNIHAFIYLLILILNWKLNPPLRTCGPHIRAEAVINFFEASVIHFAPIGFLMLLKCLLIHRGDFVKFIPFFLSAIFPFDDPSERGAVCLISK